MTSEGTRKVKAAKVEPSYPELPTSSVSCNLEMKFLWFSDIHELHGAVLVATHVHSVHLSSFSFPALGSGMALGGVFSE